ncbi:MAG: DUF2065 domain-containing protein [Burkholderiales bacterium]
MATLGAAFALMLIIEGLLPLIAPAAWREAFQRVALLRNGQIRFFGAMSVLCGAALYYVLT